MNSGFILIKKPIGPTSHDMVDRMRRITGIKKIGHAGTLDPFASGLLIMAIGREATKNLNIYLKQDKEYLADVHLGATSDTYDRTGNITDTGKDLLFVNKEKLNKIFIKFTGEIDQIPPMYSAKKINGVKLYKIARSGKVVPRQPSKIIIYKIDFLNYEPPIIKIKIRCSSGTYIRAIADDIGKELGCGAYLEELERISIGDFTIDKAVSTELLSADNWQDHLF